MQKENIYTLVGTYTPHNTIEGIDGKVYSVITYREYNLQFYNKLVAANVKWSKSLGSWIAFQMLEIPEDSLK